MADALARHLAVGAFLDLQREDHIVSTNEGEHRFRGQEPPRRRFGVFSPGYADVRTQRVRWVDQAHANIVDRLLADVMWVSPLTSLLRPGWAPPGWTPLMAVEFLRARGYVRAVCHTWAQHREWLRIGGVVAGSLLRSLELHADVFDEGIREVPGAAAAMQRAAKATLLEDDDLDADFDDEPRGVMIALPAPEVPSEPEDIGAVVGALIHLHVLKVLEFDARISIGLGARDWAVQTFLALPLLLPALESTLGSPFEGAFDRADASVAGASAVDEGFARRWEEYTEHLAGLVPRTVVDNLHRTLVQRIRG